MGKKEALKQFDDILGGLGLPVAPYAYGPSGGIGSPAVKNFVEPNAISTYYYTEGPPVITYYPPPVTYANLYAWVPCRFRVAGYPFSGFYILHDFRRAVPIDKKPFSIINHYADSRLYRYSSGHSWMTFRGETVAYGDERDSGVFGYNRVYRTNRQFIYQERSKSPFQDRPFGPVIGRPSCGVDRDISRREHSVSPEIHSPSLNTPRDLNGPPTVFDRDTQRHFHKTRDIAPLPRGMRGSGWISSGGSPNYSYCGRFSHGYHGR